MIGSMRRRASGEEIPASAADFSEVASNEIKSGQTMVANAW
jgi:hypothetical protein